MGNYEVVRFHDVTGIQCPCGLAKRAFADMEDSPASLHVVDIQADSKVHYHKAHTEIYLILEGQGHMELGGQAVPVGPFTSILIKPGCRHRAVGKMRIVNVCIPPFDPADEWFDE